MKNNLENRDDLDVVHSGLSGILVAMAVVLFILTVIVLVAEGIESPTTTKSSNTTEDCGVAEFPPTSANIFGSIYDLYKITEHGTPTKVIPVRILIDEHLESSVVEPVLLGIESLNTLYKNIGIFFEVETTGSYPFPYYEEFIHTPNNMYNSISCYLYESDVLSIWVVKRQHTEQTCANCIDRIVLYDALRNNIVLPMDKLTYPHQLVYTVNRFFGVPITSTLWTNTISEGDTAIHDGTVYTHGFLPYNGMSSVDKDDLNWLYYNVYYNFDKLTYEILTKY